MSNKERVTELLKELREDLTQLSGTDSIPNPVEKLVAATKEAFNKMDPDDKKTLKKRYETTISQFRQRREKLGGKKIKLQKDEHYLYLIEKSKWKSFNEKK